MAQLGDRLGQCEVCGDNLAKYTCPKCEVKTCCLKCVNIHKHELQCDGRRNKVAYKPVSKFTNLDLLSDYRLMEEVSRSVDSYARDPVKNYTRQFRDLPVHLYRLHAAAAKRGTNLLILPGNFSRHKENTTYLDWKTQVISWRIEWIFAQSDVKHIDNRIDESITVGELLDRHLDPSHCPRNLREPLQFYQSAGHSGVSLLLKAEKIHGACSKFHLIHSSMTLQQALRGKAVVEFPTIFVILNNHRDSYQIVDSDEEEEEYNLEEHSTSSQNIYSCQRLKRKQKKNRNNFLFHDSDYSCEESDREDRNVQKVNKQTKRSSGSNNIQVNDRNSIEITTERVRSDLPLVHHESEGKLPSASKLLNGIGHLNIPSYDELIRLPH